VPDHEYRLLNILARRDNPSQREVAREAGISLGMVNLVLRRLAKTGYIKVSQLNGQTMRYVLTPKGSTELARRSYEYLTHVVSLFGDLRNGISQLVSQLHAEGKSRFLIYGDGDVADLTHLAFQNGVAAGSEVRHQSAGTPEADADMVVLDCRTDVTPEARIGIHVLTHLASTRVGDQ
jgi:DNA-binding MarR family transcriptional regulator